jgi:hypothetical protein
VYNRHRWRGGSPYQAGFSSNQDHRIFTDSARHPS